MKPPCLTWAGWGPGVWILETGHLRQRRRITWPGGGRRWTFPFPASSLPSSSSPPPSCWYERIRRSKRNLLKDRFRSRNSFHSSRQLNFLSNLSQTFSLIKLWFYFVPTSGSDWSFVQSSRLRPRGLGSLSVDGLLLRVWNRDPSLQQVDNWNAEKTESKSSPHPCPQIRIDWGPI